MILKDINENTKIGSPEKAGQIIKAILESFDEYEQEKEHFWVLGLNTKNMIQYVDLVSIGTVSESLVHPREVFRYAILKNCSGIIIAHNHPSGSVVESKEDITITNRLVEASKIIGIKILDHIIVGDSIKSFKEHGLI